MYIALITSRRAIGNAMTTIFEAQNFRIFRGSPSNIENLVHKNFGIPVIMHIRRYIRRYQQKHFPRNLAKSQILENLAPPKFGAIIMVP